MSLTQEIFFASAENKETQLFLRREDLMHPGISGNKYRKLKYNLLAAKKEKADTLLTFGGAFSNHIAAVAFAGNSFGFRTIGIIRGDELKTRWKSNPTLSMAHRMGMEFKFVSRERYRLKDQPEFQSELRSEFGSFYLLPEGGTNALAVKGCEEILTEGDKEYDLICCSVGTGGTLAGISNSAAPHQKVLGFSALKDSSLKNHIRKFALSDNWDLNQEYHMGGFAKVNLKLINFINQFHSDNKILLDPIYTGKMMYGLFDMAVKSQLTPYRKILAIHSGGLQGIRGMNIELKRKNLPVISL